MTKRTKQIIIGAAVVIIAFVVFKIFFSNNTPSDTTLVPDQTIITVAGSQDILALLSSLNKVTLDDSIFSDRIFISLTNFERPIEDQAIGRQNPFLPIGVDNSTGALPRATSTPATSTLRAR
ncbi:MAG: hypothetical protein WCP24_01560 [bacterium]